MHSQRANVILILALAICATAAAEVTRKGEGCLCPGMTKIARVPTGTDCSAYCGTSKKSDDRDAPGRSKPSCQELASKSGLSSFYHPDSVVKQFLLMHPECAASIPWRGSSSYVPSTSDEALIDAGAALIDSIFDAIGQHQANKKLRKQQEAIDEQARMQRMRDAQQQRSELFDRDKRETLALMKGTSSSLALKTTADSEQSRLRQVSTDVHAGLASLMDSLGVGRGGRLEAAEAAGCDDTRCLEGCPTIAGVMGSREVDAACVRRCAASSCPGASSSAPVPAGGGESDYFYDLQMRQTMPGLTPPLAEMSRLEGRYADSWRLADPEISVDRSVLERLEEAKHESADRTIEWAKEQAIDHVLEKIPGASTLKSTYQTMMPIADSVITNAFDRLNEAPAVLAFGEARDADAAIGRAENTQAAVHESIEAAAHGQLLDSVAGKVWKDQLTEGIKDSISERWGFALGGVEEDPEHTFLSRSVWSIPEHPDAFRWRGSGGGR